MIAGTFAHTLFDGRTLEHKQRAAEQTFVQQTAQYRSVALTAFQNVADALIALDADDRAIKAAEAAEKAAQKSLDLIRQQLNQGQVSLPALLTAQQAFLQTSIARVQAQASRLASTVALFQALGGGWWNRRDPVVAVVEPGHPTFHRRHHHVTPDHVKPDHVEHATEKRPTPVVRTESP